jgi:hypothetical protein
MVAERKPDLPDAVIQPILEVDVRVIAQSVAITSCRDTNSPGRDINSASSAAG